MKPSYSSLRMFLTAWLAVFSTGNHFAIAENQTSPDDSFHIVGYLPDYRVSNIDPGVGRYLSDLIFFSVTPEENGRFTSEILDSPKTILTLKEFRKKQDLKIYLCVGGWDHSNGFAKIAATPDSRQRFASGLLNYCRERHFAGADID